MINKELKKKDLIYQKICNLLLEKRIFILIIQVKINLDKFPIC